MNSSYGNRVSDNLLIDLNAGFAVIGCCAAIANVVLILITRTYHQYIHRLQLYLAVVSLVFAAALGFETLPVTIDANDTATVPNGSWRDACSAIAYVAQHFGFAKAYCIVWICFYVFMLAMFQKQLRQLRYELTGLIVVFALPAATAWIPMLHGSYGLVGIWCWIKVGADKTTVVFQFALSQGSEILLHAISIVLLCFVVSNLSRGLFRSRGRLSSPHKAALMEVLPLIVYPAIYSIANFVSATKSIYDAATHGKKPNGSMIDEMVVVCFLQTFLLALPLSFLMHPSVRRELGRQWRAMCRRSPKLPVVAVTSTTMESERHTQLSDHASNAIQAEGEKEQLLNSRSVLYGIRASSSSGIKY